MNLTRTGSIICMLTLAVCVADRGNGDGTFGGNGPPGADGSSSDAGADDGADDGGDGGGDDGGTSDGDSGGIKYDVENGTGGGPGDEEEVCGKVDFLFVVDNSGSMLMHQQNLVANWPAFISGIQSTLTQVDSYQVGVISSDAAYYSNVDECHVMGGLIVENSVEEQKETCGPYANGLNFMTEADDLDATFECAATMDDGTNDEVMMAAVEAAVERQFGGAGECNEGFLRDDSLLIIVLLTDECDGPGCMNHPEGKSPGGPSDWYDAVVAARGGIESNIVVLSILQYEGGPCPPPTDMGQGVFDQLNAIQIKDFTDMFTHGFVGGICEADYGPYFQQAIDLIDTACDEYRPPEG